MTRGEGPEVENDTAPMFGEVGNEKRQTDGESKRRGAGKDVGHSSARSPLAIHALTLVRLGQGNGYIR